MNSVCLVCDIWHVRPTYHDLALTVQSSDVVTLLRKLRCHLGVGGVVFHGARERQEH